MAALRADDDGGCQTGHEELVMEAMPSTPYAESHHIPQWSRQSLEVEQEAKHEHPCRDVYHPPQCVPLPSVILYHGDTCGRESELRADVVL
jgi:hypothetical protein